MTRCVYRMFGLATLVATILAAACAMGAEKQAEQKERVDSREQSGGAWLGVIVFPVSESLQAQLQTDKGALVVDNVVVDSPADRAGIERFDVIVKLDGERLPNDFAAAVRDREVGAEVELTVIHQAKTKDVRVKLEAAPARGKAKYKYHAEGDGLFRDSYTLGGKILRPGPNGGYIVDDLGKWPMVERFTLPVPPPVYGGQVEERTKDAVRRAEEAQRRAKDWQEAMRRYGEQFERFRDLYGQFEGKFSGPTSRGARSEWEGQDCSDRKFTAFSVDSDGKITATVRRGDSEMTMHFENEEQFKEKAPELFERFQEAEKLMK